MDQSFYDQVFDLVRLIPRGRVSSYGVLAKSIGGGSSARMVGYAMSQAGMAQPPVPAHRVVNSSGLLTGKFHFETTGRMQELLESEGVVVRGDKVQNFKTLLWNPLIELNI